MVNRRALDTYGYDIYVTDALPVGIEALIERDYLAGHALDDEDAQARDELDAILIEQVMDGSVIDVLLDAHPDHLLADWWWYLGAIRSGTYPPDLLPEPLRAVYRVAADQTS